MPRWVLVLAPLMLVASHCARAAPAQPAAARAAGLAPGDAVFWDGPFVESSSVGGGCGGDPCWDFRIEVEAPAHRLRIGIDHPEVGDVFEVEVSAPGGAAAGSFSPGAGLYSAEHLVEEPDPGTWRVRVIARDVTASAFRVRAKLEARAPRLHAVNGRVLPNLQVLPPHDASFLTPITNGSGDEIPEGFDGGSGCHPEEHAEDGAVRCLRFGFGIRNTGRGPMYLSHSGPPVLDHDLYQHVYRPDETYFERRAGVARYHKSHGHYHHHDAVALRLLRVVDPVEGVLEPAGDKHHKGFAHRDELIRDWRRFYPLWARTGFGLSAGWSDIYEWDRPGNYVDFGLNEDGRYVVRMWADPPGGILESNERDNVGYTYLKVTGSDVRLIEAGRGRGPWDPCKIVVGFGGHPDPQPSPRPRRCPPDTI
ncbi:MAG: hypothetical protein ABR575_07490 [Actinomycetota bacterium]